MENYQSRQSNNFGDYDKIRDDWMSQDKVAKCLGMFSSPRLYEDWQTAEPDEDIRKKASWKLFIESMQKAYQKFNF